RSVHRIVVRQGGAVVGKGVSIMLLEREGWPEIDPLVRIDVEPYAYISPMAVIQTSRRLLLGIELVGVGADEVFPIGEAIGFVAGRIECIIGVDIEALIQPLVVVIGRNVIRIIESPPGCIAPTPPSTVITPAFLFPAGNTRHRKIRLVYVVSYREYGYPAVAIKAIQVPAPVISLVGPIPGRRPTEIAFAAIGARHDIDHLTPLPVIKTAELRLFTLLVDDLYFSNDIGREGFQCNARVCTEKLFAIHNDALHIFPLGFYPPLLINLYTGDLHHQRIGISIGLCAKRSRIKLGGIAL